MKESKKGILTDVTQETIALLDAISEMEGGLVEAKIKEFPRMELPIKIGHEKKSWGNDWFYDFEPEKVKDYLRVPEHYDRLIYCPKINVDLTDDWGMFGYEPGFIFIRGINRKPVTPIEKALMGGMTVKREPRTGLWFIPHYDFFPRYLFNDHVIRQSDNSTWRGMFNVIAQVVEEKVKKNMGGGQTRTDLPKLPIK